MYAYAYFNCFLICFLLIVYILCICFWTLVATFASKYQIVNNFLFCPLFGGQWINEMGRYLYICVYVPIRNSGYDIWVVCAYVFQKSGS